MSFKQNRHDSLVDLFARSILHLLHLSSGPRSNRMYTIYASTIYLKILLFVFELWNLARLA